MKLTPTQYNKLIQQLDNIMKSRNDPRAKLKDLRSSLEGLFNILEPKSEYGLTLALKMKAVFKNHPEHRVVRKEAEAVRTELNDIIHDSDFSYNVNESDVDRIYQSLFVLIKHFGDIQEKLPTVVKPKINKAKNKEDDFYYSTRIREMNIDGKILGMFVIIDMCAEWCKKQYSVDIRKDKMSMMRLESTAWEGVKEFALKDKIRINLPYISFIGNDNKSPLHLDIEFSYSEYETFYKEIGGELFPKIFRKWDKN